MYPFGRSENDATVGGLDDIISDPILLSRSFRWYGEAIEIAYVSFKNTVVTLSCYYLTGISDWF